MYLDQTQEADFHLELAQSAKLKSEREKKEKEKKKKPNCLLPTPREFQPPKENQPTNIQKTFPKTFPRKHIKAI